MTVEFTAQRLMLQPGNGDEILIDDGDRTVPVKPKPEPPVKPKPEPLHKSPELPPFGVMRLIQDGAVVSSLQPIEEEDGVTTVEARVQAWIATHGTPESLEVDVHASSVTDDELGPLLAVGHRHQIPIAVHLRSHG